MNSRTKRRVVDFLIFVTTYAVLFTAGAKYWALLIIPYGLWNYYDGLSRSRPR